MKKKDNMLTKAKIWILVLTLAATAFNSACDPDKKYREEEEEKIQKYLDDHPDLEFVLKESGLYYCDVVVGSGLQAEKHDTAYVKYTGKYLDGYVFDTNVGTDDTLLFPVDEGWMVKGFDEGITYMKEGGSAIFLLPSTLAYYNYTPILFEVNLVKLDPYSGKKK